MAMGVLALAGWALLAATGGGIDPGDGLGGGGPTGAFVALAAGAPLALAAVLAARDRAALRSRPALIALGGAAGLAVWSGLSIVWAAAPDLAWIEANRQAIALGALALGLALGALLPRAPLQLGLGITVAAALPIAMALGTKLLPALLGNDRDLARLADPVGYWNALALIAAMAVPGLMWLAGGGRRPNVGPAVAGAGLALVGTTLMLTYSRGGLLATAMAVGVTLAFLPWRGAAVAAIVAGAAGAALPAGYALTTPLLATDQVPTDLREGAGASLGWRLAVGVVVAAVLAPLLTNAWARIAVDRRRGRRVAYGGIAAICLIVAVGAVATPSGRHWVDTRVTELQGDGGTAVANDPGRLVNVAGNQRSAWWDEAWRAFEAAPIAGQGAGGFALVHLQERRNGDDALATREAHSVVLGVLSGTGLVGLALLAALVGAVGWAVVRAVERRTGPEIGLPLAILAAFALQSVIDWSWSIPALTVPALAAGGVVLAAAAPGGGPGACRPGSLAAGALAACVTIALASAALPWWAARATAQGEDALGANNPRRALSLADDARAVNPLSIQPLLLAGGAYTDMGQPARALGAYQEATRVQPDNPDAWRALAIFLGADHRARAAWERVRRLDPQNPEAALRAP